MILQLNKKHKYNYYKDLISEIDTIIDLYVNQNKSTPQIAKEYNTDKGVIRYILRKNNIKLRAYRGSDKNYTVDEHYFDKINTPNKAYILGLLYADGNNSLKYNRIKLSLWDEDKQILEDIRKEMKIEKPLFLYKRHHKNPKHHDAYELTIYSKHMCKQLNKKGCVPRKSLILQWPTWIRKDLYSHFIRGYFDGDGSISKASLGANANFVSSMDFCIGLSNFLKDKGIENFIREVPTNKKTGRVVISKKEQTRKLCEYMYKDADLFMQRKYDIYLMKFPNAKRELLKDIK